MAGCTFAAKCILPVVLLSLWIEQVKALGCNNVPEDQVVQMCNGTIKTAPRLFLETYTVPSGTSNCTCYLSTTADKLGISLLAAPRYTGCQSGLEFMSSSPFTFECLISGIGANVSTKKQFDVNFVRTSPDANNNYCADIRAEPSPGGSITTVTLNCPSIYSTTSTSTSTTSTSTTSTTTTTTSRPTSDSQTETSSDGQVTGRETTTENQTTATEETTSPTTTFGNTGFPSSVSQTAIIIICVIVGAGLLVGIIIAVVAILGKRNETRHKADKHRFSVPRNNNFELAAENGTANDNNPDSIKADTDGKLYRTQASSDIKYPVSHAVYENNGYLTTEIHKDTLVVSDRL